MVFVNNQKFACESCIKGHRSSSCSHTDRPLFEIKKKGRPVSQCEKCRELRQSRKLHSKCNCAKETLLSVPMHPLASASKSKTKRYIPAVPTLPNGLKDIITSSPPVSTSDSRQQVGSLLNPCNCRNVWQCNCNNTQIQSDSGLTALIEAARINGDVLLTNTVPPEQDSPAITSDAIMRDHFVLPSLMTTDISSHPTFPLMPPLSAIVSLAGTGCTCGVECGCPGCEEHRGPFADTSRQPCATGCGTCVDSSNGIALPGHESTAAISMFDQFLLRAATLPVPPANRKNSRGARLDPTNVTIYPAAAMETQKWAEAFGLINVPKLECCGGQCGCPTGTCECGKSCDGCCAEHLADTLSAEGVAKRTGEVVPVPNSCCADRCC